LTQGATYAATPEQIDVLAEKWIRIKRQEQSIRKDWQLRKQSLSQQLDLLRNEKNALLAKVESSQQTQGAVEQRRRDLLRQQSELEQDERDLRATLKTLEARISELMPLLPPPLKENWDSAQQSDEGASTRLMAALKKLSELRQFALRSSLVEGPLTTSDGERLFAKQLYLGAAFAWFVTADGKRSGTGQVTDRRWQWQIRDDVDNEAVASAIEIFEKKQGARFIELPVFAHEEQRLTWDTAAQVATSGPEPAATNGKEQ